jgi:hypothetical protein
MSQSYDSPDRVQPERTDRIPAFPVPDDVKNRLQRVAENFRLENPGHASRVASARAAVAARYAMPPD